MNKKIREIIDQCTETTEIVNPVTGITHHREFFDKEKFAELIITECARLFPAEYDTVEGKVTIGKIIKEHFGVKE